MKLTLWRDHDDAVLDLPGVALGEHPLPADVLAAVAGWYRAGVRRAAFAAPLNLSSMDTPHQTVQALVALRELTSWGIVADWDVVLGDHIDRWRQLSHLQPPRSVLDGARADAALADWRDTFYLGKCFHRHGPGFIQVRDRRLGMLIRFTIDDPAYLSTVDALIAGAPRSAVPPQVLADFVGEHLVGEVGDLVWWLPYRVRRWPWPAMVV
jgi:Family of unknown function (DUF5825)